MVRYGRHPVCICGHELFLTHADKYLVQALNASGAIGIAVASFAKREPQPGILNIVWALIALIAITKALF